MAIFIKEATIDALKQARRGYGFAKRTSRLFLSGVLASNVGYEAIVDIEGKGNYTSIQSALDAGKTKIFLRAGTYIIDKAVTITQSNILIVGEDWSNTILKAKVALNDSIIILGDGSNSYSNITLYNLQIDGDQTNQTGGTDKGLVHITKGISQLRIERCDIKNMYSSGIYAIGASQTVLSNSSIINNKIHDAKQDIAYPDGGGIRIDDSQKLTIRGNHIYNCGAGGGIFVDDTYNLIVANNFVYSTGNGGTGINIGSSTPVPSTVISGNRIIDNEGVGISGSGNFMTVTGNYLENNSVNTAFAYPAEIYVIAYCSVVGNVIKITTASRSDYGIYASGDYNSITGNVGDDDSNAATGIYLNGDGNVLTGNIMHDFGTAINDAGASNVQYVDLLNAQTVAGIKTFSSFPITPSSAPTTDYQVSNKKYVDDEIGGLTETYSAGNTLLIADYFERSNFVPLPTWTKVAEIRIDRSGTLRIKFDLKISAGGSGSEARAQIYRNGSAVGTFQEDDSSETYKNFSEDIAGWSAGDLVQLYSTTSNATYSADTKNFEIYVAADEDASDRKPLLNNHWEALTIDTIYRAGTNGLVVVRATQSSGGGVIDGYTDSSNPPTTLRCRVYMQQTYSKYATFTMPVKKGDYWEVNDDTDVIGAAVIYWFPLEYQ